MVCPDCGHWYANIVLHQGKVRGLCGECSELLYRLAARRGIALLVPKGKTPSYNNREFTIEGRKIWWWRGQWRFE